MKITQDLLAASLLDIEAITIEMIRRGYSLQKPNHEVKFDEGQHPRDEAGRFTDGGGGSVGEGSGGGDQPNMSLIREVSHYKSGVETGAAPAPDGIVSDWTPSTGGSLLHGAQQAFNNNWKTDIAYLTDDFKEARGYALGEHLGGSGGKYPMVQRFIGVGGKTLDIDAYLAHNMADDWDPDHLIKLASDHAREVGARFMTYEHPSNYDDKRMQRVVISLYPKEDLKFKTLWRVSRPKPKKEVASEQKILLADAPALVHLADRMVPAMRRRFLEAIQSIRSTLDAEKLNQLAQAIAARNISQAEMVLEMGKWPEKFGGLSIDLRAGFIAGAELGIGNLRSYGIDLNFFHIDPHTVEFARNRLPTLVGHIKKNAEEMVRKITVRAVEGEFTPFQAAEKIKDWIGMTRQQSDAAIEFRNELRDRGIPEDKIEARAKKYEEALIKERAEMIARTEILHAENAGQLESWAEARRQGLLPTDVHKQWIVADDERLCDVCENLGSADPVPLKEQFRYDDGELAKNVFDEPLFGPPQHPRCRCTMVLDFEKGSHE